MKLSGKFLLLAVISALLIFAALPVSAQDDHVLVLENGTASLDGAPVPEYDYAWHADPSVVHDEVKDAPAEYYTGTEPSGEDAVYIAHDIFYYPEVPAEGFKKVRYDDDTEWVYYYPAEEYQDFIWANLPVQGSSVPLSMMHSEEDAWNNPVLHITQPGTYLLSGTWQGQILVDLGDQDETFSDPEAKVTLILNGVDVTCTVAPALIFYSVYEADNTWEERESYSPDVDITDAGAKVVLADDTENTFTGTNVYRMLKAKYKDPESTDAVKTQKKMRKTDAAFYSFRSMLIEGAEKGNGVLNVVSGFEGLDSELHLTINSGKVNIQSQDDGMNVNEDGVSVLTVNGGELHIVAGLGAEGDGVDSNGYLVVNGGIVISAAKPMSDSGLDSDFGSYVNGGYVVATGSTMDWAESDSRQVTMNLQFASDQASDEAIIVTDTEGNVIFAYDPDKDETAGLNNRGYKGAVISCPEFKVGETYHVYVGGDVEGTETDGLYEASTVTGFSGAVRQVYTGTDVRGFGPGGRGGGFGPGGRPDGMGEPPARPEGMGEPPARPEGMGEPPAFPDGMEAGPERPEGMGEPPEGNGPGGFFGGPFREVLDELFDDEEEIPAEGEPFTISEDAAEEILEEIRELDPDSTVTLEEIMAVTDVDGLMALCFRDMPMGGPGGGFPGGDFPGGGFGGPDAANQGEPSADFYMNDTVNAFSGVTDETAAE